MKLRLAVAIWMGLASWLFAADFYVAQQDPRAAESNPGTEALPFKTISNACAAAQAGDTVYIKAGTYREALIPKHSGAEGKPITFQAYKKDFVMIKGSEVLTGLEREGTNLWVKHPWTRVYYWDDSFKDYSVAPYRESARADQVFINEAPMQWVPSRKELKPGCFFWNAKQEKKGEPAGGELVICPPEGVADLNQTLVEIPVLASVLCAWQGDGSLGQIRKLYKDRPEQAAIYDERKWPQIHYIHVKGLNFRHNYCIHNRYGVRLDGDYWLLENCTVEYMNAMGVLASGDHGIIRNCAFKYNGQSAFGCFGSDNLYENCVTLHNNRKRYSVDYGGGGNNIIGSDHFTVRGLISAFNYGPGLWYDIDNRNVLVEDCLSIGGAPVNGDFMYEIGWDAVFRRNVSFASQGGTGGDFFLSDSATTLVEDNVAIGGNGGVSVGYGRVRTPSLWLRPEMKIYTAYSNTVRNNLIVEPRDFAFAVRRNALSDSTTPQANNRFLDNTVLARYGSAWVRFGFDAFETPEAYDKAVSLGRNNRSVTDLAQLGRKDRARLNEAMKKVLNALPLVEPRLDFKFSKVSLEEIWLLEAETRIIGYWVKADGQRYLLLDAPVSDGNIQLFDAGTREVVLWDFSWRGPPTRTPLLGEGGMFTARNKGYFVLITGLSKEAHPLAEVFSARAELDGKPVKALAEGKAFVVALRLSNPFDCPVEYTVSGPKLGGKWSVALPPQGVAATNLPMVAEPLKDRFVYELSSSRMPTNRRTVRVTVETPASAPYWREVTVDPANASDNSRTLLPSLTLDSEAQHVKGLYDVTTGKGWRGPEDLSGKVWCGWNEKGLCFLAQVQDDALVTNRGAAYDRDCVELFLDGRVKELGNRVYTPGVYQFLLRAPEPGPTTAVWQPLKWEGAVTNGMSGRCRVTTNGYEIEATVSWALFPELKPATGIVIGVDVALDDADYNKSDGIYPLRKTQLVWHGSSDNWQDASLFGLMKLGPAAEAEFAQPFQSGDIVVREVSGRLAIYRDGSGSKPLQTIGLKVEGRLASDFVGGSICFDAERNFYFLDGDMNMRLQMLPAGGTRSQILHEFSHPQEKENPYCFGVSLIAVGKDRLLVLTGGSLMEFFPSRRATGKKYPFYRRLWWGGRGGAMAISPDGQWLAGISSAALALTRLDDMAGTNRLDDSSGLMRAPTDVAFIPGTPPFLAVVSGFVAVDDPAIAPAIPWKDGGEEAFRASTNSRMHVLRFDYDAATGGLTPPPCSNLKDGKSFSLVAHRTPDGHPYLSSFETLALDSARNRVLMSNRTQARNGANIYAVSLDRFAKGGLVLADLEPLFAMSAIIKGIAIAP